MSYKISKRRNKVIKLDLSLEMMALKDILPKAAVAQKENIITN
jgi:hypothetical protein